MGTEKGGDKPGRPFTVTDLTAQRLQVGRRDVARCSGVEITVESMGAPSLLASAAGFWIRFELYSLESPEEKAGWWEVCTVTCATRMRTRRHGRIAHTCRYVPRRVHRSV